MGIAMFKCSECGSVSCAEAHAKEVERATSVINIHGLARSKTILADAPPDAECFSWLLGDSGVYDKTVVLAELRDALEFIAQHPDTPGVEP